MFVLSFTSLIEETIADENVSNLSGNVSSFDKLIRKESLELLESKHKGLFAYLAFHPNSDPQIVDYIKQGTLSSDSGSNILVLFTLDSEAKWATPISSTSFGAWLNIDNTLHPSYELVRIMFNKNTVPPLPGIVLFEKFTGQREPVYVSLQNYATVYEVNKALRTIFSLADSTFKKSRTNGNFEDLLGLELQKNKFIYQKTGKTSMAEWLVKAYQVVKEHKGDIVNAVKLFK